MGIEEKNYYFNQIKNEANRLGFKFESRPYGTRTPHSFSIVIDGNEVLGVIKYSEDANRIYQGIAASLSRHFSKFTYVIIIDEVLSRVLILPWNLINRTYQRMSGYGTYPHVTFTIERKNGQYMIKGGNYIPDEYVDNVPNTEKVFRVVFNLKEV